MMEDQFNDVFAALTGNKPFPWQWELYKRFADGKVPKQCNIPTGLGKTSVIAVWLIALAYRPGKMPRRLVYVVNRRTVVDQTTEEVERLRRKLQEAGLRELRAALTKLCALDTEVPLALSTLRGQFADNREWSADPARPAVISGTVDMIGSRLLFNGYGVGFKGKPLHAGFLGQDALLVHDEAHLEPAFQQLIERIEQEQQDGERVGELPWRKLQVMALTATSRSDDSLTNEIFELTDVERAAPRQIPDPPTEPLHVAWRRLTARKAIVFHPVEQEKRDLADAIADRAFSGKIKDSSRAILIFVRTVENVERIFAKLKKENKANKVQQLTGTMRGLERDDLPKDTIFARFLPTSSRPNAVVPAEGTAYLICTSAGEVGVNLSAGHLICDLTTFESMAQRFGRVNRFGDYDDTEVHVFHPVEFNEDEPYELRRKKTLALLKELDGDASPIALGRLDAKARLGAFAPEPTILPVTDVLFDSWALTSINRPLVKQRLPGRPDVEPYLHGREDEALAETSVGWRDEVGIITGSLLEMYAPEALLEDYPLKPHELLHDNSGRVFERLRKLKVDLSTPVWIVTGDGSVEVMTLEGLINAGKGRIYSKTVLLPPAAGGLRSGMLVSDSEHAEDVSDCWWDDLGQQRRVRFRNDKPTLVSPDDMRLRLIRSIDTRPDDESEEGQSEPSHDRYWHWFELARRPDTQGSEAAAKPVLLMVHTDDVERNATAIAQKLLPDNLTQALMLAARWHDRGKRRELWQRNIGNLHPEYTATLLAKSGGRIRARALTPYRHEFGSLLDAEDEREFQSLDDDAKDLILHLIASHHGRGRPHFPADEAFDPEPRQKDIPHTAAAVPRRYARLQAQYGRWGLAYLESLLRAADYAASSKPSAFLEESR